MNSEQRASAAKAQAQSDLDLALGRLAATEARRKQLAAEGGVAYASALDDLETDRSEVERLRLAVLHHEEQFEQAKKARQARFNLHLKQKTANVCKGLVEPAAEVDAAMATLMVAFEKLYDKTREAAQTFPGQIPAGSNLHLHNLLRNVAQGFYRVAYVPNLGGTHRAAYPSFPAPQCFDARFKNNPGGLPSLADEIAVDVKWLLKTLDEAPLPERQKPVEAVAEVERDAGPMEGPLPVIAPEVKPEAVIQSETLAAARAHSADLNPGRDLIEQRRKPEPDEVEIF